jgi:hypothetical protein
MPSCHLRRRHRGSGTTALQHHDLGRRELARIAVRGSVSAGHQRVAGPCPEARDDPHGVADLESVDPAHLPAQDLCAGVDEDRAARAVRLDGQLPVVDGTDAALGTTPAWDQDVAAAAAGALLQGSGADPGGMAGGLPGPGGPGGFGFGLEGTIEAIEDGQLTITSDGTSSTVLVDETTTIARQEALALDDLRDGDSVRVTPGRGPGPGFGMAPGGDPATAGDADAQQAASQVIVLGGDGA